MSSQRKHFSGHEKEGVDFFLVGDYGWVQDLTDSFFTFGMMNELVKNASLSENPNTYDLVDFFVTAGDNLYPVVPDAPTDEEFEKML
jgi:hypothetical protein